MVARIAITLTLIFGLVTLSEASNCHVGHVRAVQNYHYVPHYNYKQIIATTFVPVQVPYAISYAPGYSVAQTDASLKEQLLQIKLELKDLRIQFLELQLSTQGGSTEPAPDKTGSASPALLGVLTSKCASCHDEKRSAASGAGFTMFAKDGSLLELNADTKLLVMREILSGKMPKGGSLTPEELNVIVQGMSGVKLTKGSSK